MNTIFYYRSLEVAIKNQEGKDFMKKIVTGIFVLLVCLLVYGLYLQVSRSEKTTNPQYPNEFLDSQSYCKEKSKKQFTFQPNQIQELLTLINSLEECTTIQLDKGVFRFSNSFTINNVNGIIVKGVGRELTTLLFSREGNGNGIDVESSHSFTIQDLKIVDSPKNGLEIRLSENVIIDNIEVTWSVRTGEEMSKNGAYGVYPVNVTNLILRNSNASFASDAGLYVGQCVNAWVYKNRAEFNVMGLEIENTINALVYENILTNNTGGFLAYDLNKNTIVSRNIQIFKNKIYNNNNPNFASAGIVKTVSAGVGMVLTSTREVEVTENYFSNNNTTDIAILSGIVAVSSDFSSWPMKNWRTYKIFIHDNEFNGDSGTSIDNGNINEKDRPLGALISLFHEIWSEQQIKLGNPKPSVANIIYDGVEYGKTMLALTTWFGDKNGNFNEICLKNNSNGKVHPTLLDINLVALLNNSEDPTKESILNSIQKGKSILYTQETNYGGSPTKGFSCEGYKFQGMPVKVRESL